MRLTRRGFLTGVLVTIAAAAGAREGVRFDRTAGSRDAARLSCLFRHPEGAAQLGQRYLETTADKPDIMRLVELIGKHLELESGPIHKVPEDELRASLARRIRTDFSRGNTVALDGWVLSVTEARLCALVSLVPRCQGMAGS